MARESVEYAAVSSGPASDSVILAHAQANSPDNRANLVGAVVRQVAEQQEMTTYRLDLI